MTGGNKVIHLFICSKGCDSYYPIRKQRQTALVEIGRSICRSREGRWLICITLRNLVRRVWKRKKRNFSLVLTQKLLSGFKKKNYNFFFAVGIKMFFLDETDLSRMMWNKFHSTSYLRNSKVDTSFWEILKKSGYFRFYEIFFAKIYVLSIPNLCNHNWLKKPEALKFYF